MAGDTIENIELAGKADYLEGYSRKKEFIRELKDDGAWYDSQKKLLNFVWITGTIAVLVLSSLTSLLVALGVAGSDNGRVILAVMPALAALIAALLAQFQVRELWELREMGRISIIELVNEASLVTAATDVEMRALLAPLKAKRVELSRAQASRFFASMRKTISLGSADKSP